MMHFVVIDLCVETPGLCQNGGTCSMLGPLNYTCACFSGYSGDGCEEGQYSKNNTINIMRCLFRVKYYL